MHGIRWVPGKESLHQVTVYRNLGSNASAVVKAAAGNVYFIGCINTNSSARYFQLHNVASALSGNEVPYLTFFVPGAGACAFGQNEFTLNGIHMSTGITFAFSTAKDTYVAGTAGEQSSIVFYV